MFPWSNRCQTYPLFSQSRKPTKTEPGPGCIIPVPYSFSFHVGTLLAEHCILLLCKNQLLPFPLLNCVIHKKDIAMGTVWSNSVTFCVLKLLMQWCWYLPSLPGLQHFRFIKEGARLISAIFHILILIILPWWTTSHFFHLLFSKNHSLFPYLQRDPESQTDWMLFYYSMKAKPHFAEFKI